MINYVQSLKKWNLLVLNKDLEIKNIFEKLNKNERENTMLRKANDSLQTTINQQVKTIKNLKSSTKENKDEKEINDQITNELIDKINQYESTIEELNIENQNLTSQLEEMNDIALKIPEYESTIEDLQWQIEDVEGSRNEEVNSRLLEIKEESLLKQSENQRLKEKNETLGKQVEEFKREFDSLQDYINIKDDQIRNKFKDEEVWVCIQILLKELILINKNKAFEILDIQNKVTNEDLDYIIRSHYLTDSYVRFVIVNSVAYLQEWKESLNYLKQKYAESELKYDGIIGKYQNVKNEKVNLQNNSAMLENNVNRLMEENQKLNEEKFLILKNWAQNPNISQNPSFMQSLETWNLQRTFNDKENLSNFAFDDDESSVNIYQGKAPLSSRMHNNKMSVDNSNLIGSRIRASQNLSNVNKHTNSVSNKISWEGFGNPDMNNQRNKNGSMLSNHNNYASSTSISFYKPHNTMKKYNKASASRSSVSIKGNNNSQNVSKTGKSHIENKRRQLIKSIDSFPDSQNRNWSRSTKHHRMVAQSRKNTSKRRA